MWDIKTVSKMGPTWACQNSGFWGKTRRSGQPRPEQIKWGTKRHKGWPAAGTTWNPIEGTRHPQALYQSPDHEVSLTPTPPPPSGLAPSRLGSPNRDYPRTMHETTRPGFASVRGGGDIHSCLVLWRGTSAHASSHLWMTQAPLRSWPPPRCRPQTIS
jgi:hypothetical protein